MIYPDLDDDALSVFFNISDLIVAEVKLHETEQMNRRLLNSTSEIILKLSADLKIAEMNSSAEKYFGKKLEEIRNKNYDTFVPDAQKEKSKIDLNRIMNKSHDTGISMQITRGDKITAARWAVNVLLNNLNVPSGMILSTKKS